MSEVARMQLRLPYTAQDEDRHGKTRTYCRFRGRKKRLPDPTDPAFLSAYQSALEELKAPNAASDGSKARRVFAGTFEWLGRAYMCSVEFRQLDARSQRTRMNVLERCFAEPHRKGSGTRLGDCPLSSFGPIQLKVLRDRKAELPGAANNRLKYISAMYAWAIENHHATSNPTRDIKPLSCATSGFHPWTDEEVCAFEHRHPIGSKARLALALLLWTGARRQDVVRFGKQHIRDGVLTFIPRKTEYLRDDALFIPVFPELREILAASPTGDLTFLETEYKRAFTPAGFGGWFRKRCDEAGLWS